MNEQKQKYQIQNWRAYDAALVGRGSLTVWLDEASLRRSTLCWAKKESRRVSIHFTVKIMLNHPLAEVFGHSTTDFSNRAQRFRKNKLCPFNNKVPSCTKDKAKDPLGVCSVYHGQYPVITCPVRFREDWLIADDAAAFFFPDGSMWTSLTEVRLADGEGKSAGNIDVVLVAYNSEGKVVDFGSLEVQAVYISGNVREPFAHYMADCAANQEMDWRNEPNYPRPDFLSSSRKRLAPQLIFKGGILNAWGKKWLLPLTYHFLTPCRN